jgi:hypothetical protein
LAVWEIINEEDAFLIPKILGENFPKDFCTNKFLGSLSRYAATIFIVALSPDHSDKTRFRPFPPFTTGIHLDQFKKKFKSCSDDWHRSCSFLVCVQHLGTHFAESFRIF